MRKFLRSTHRCWMVFSDADKGAASNPGGGKGEGNPSPAPAPEPTPAPNPAPEPAPAPEGSPAPKTEATAKPSVFAKAAAMLKDKSELLGTITAHEGTIKDLTAQLSNVSKERDDFKTRAETAEGQIAEFTKQVDDLTKAQTTTEKAAQDKIAALGFPADKLPASTNAEGTEVPKDIQAFQKMHGELSQKDAGAASKFYAAHAWRFGLEPKPASASA